jgi:solute carrier family 25 2-oxodicarboxylate transporter 21
MDCISKIYKYEGAYGFLRGMEATVWRHALWNGGYFGVIQ